MIRPGTMINTYYKVLDTLGSGGDTILYKVQNVQTGELYAMRPVASSDKQKTGQNAINVLLKLSNPFLPKIKDFVSVEYDLYVLFEYVEGKDLETLTVEGKILSEKQVRKYGVQICEAVRYLHSQDLLHGAVRPRNVIIKPNDDICLIGMDVNTVMNGVNSYPDIADGYAAPEQCRGLAFAPEQGASPRLVFTDVMNHPHEFNIVNDRAPKVSVKQGLMDQRSDIFSIGSTLYTAATGRNAMYGMTDFSHSDLPEQVTQVIDKAMRVAPADRIGSIDVIINTLRGTASPKAAAPKPARSAGSRSGGGFPLKPFLIGIGAVAVIGIIAGVVLGLKDGEKDITKQTGSVTQLAASDAAVPDLTLMTEEEAVTKLRSLNIPFEIQYERSSAGQPGDVISQSVLGGEKLSNGETLVLTVCSDVEGAVIPYLSGREASVAMEELEEQGFAYRVEYEETADVPEGTVIRQEPDAGTASEGVSEIVIYVSGTGDTVAVPALENMTEEQAVAALEAAGLVPDVIYEDDPAVAYGNVIRQGLSAGTQVQKDSSIMVYVSSLNETVEVPALIYKTEEEARAELEALGLVAKTEYEDDARVNNRCVFKQSVRSGSQVNKGSEVIIYVSTHSAKVEVPSLLYLTEFEARQKLKGLGLAASVTYADDNRVEYGCVFSQSVRSGTQVEAGTTVEISVSNHRGVTVTEPVAEETVMTTPATSAVTTAPVTTRRAQTTKKQTETTAKKSSITDVLVSETNVTLTEGETFQLTVGVLPKTENQAVRIKSSNPAIAKSSNAGLIQALAPGQCTLTIRAADDISIYKEVKVRVLANTPVKYISTNTLPTLHVGDTTKVTVHVDPVNATDKTVVFKSSNSSIAEVDQEGNVKAKYPGTVTITVMSSSTPDVTAEVAVNVIE